MPNSRLHRFAYASVKERETFSLVDFRWQSFAWEAKVESLKVFSLRARRAYGLFTFKLFLSSLLSLRIRWIAFHSSLFSFIFLFKHLARDAIAFFFFFVVVLFVSLSLCLSRLLSSSWNSGSKISLSSSITAVKVLCNKCALFRAPRDTFFFSFKCNQGAVPVYAQNVFAWRITKLWSRQPLRMFSSSRN